MELYSTFSLLVVVAALFAYLNHRFLHLPPISVASAVEGLRILKPDLNTVPIVILILVALFAFQQFGTAIIGKFFGLVMVLFFSRLAVLGFKELVQDFSILRALNPYYAVHMVTQVPGAFWLLGSIFLCILVTK